jgi:hypothetical protein
LTTDSSHIAIVVNRNFNYLQEILVEISVEARAAHGWRFAATSRRGFTTGESGTSGENKVNTTADDARLRFPWYAGTGG